MAPIIAEKRSRRTRKSKNVIIALLLALVLVFAGITFYALTQKRTAEQERKKAEEQYKRLQVLKVAEEAFLEMPKDNTRALRLAWAGYELGLPQPPARACQALAAAGYSSFEEPIYLRTMEHKGPVYSAVFSSDGQRLLTASSDGTAKVWLTPEAIYEWLKTSPIPPLSSAERKELGIE